MNKFDHTNDDASMALVQQHNQGRTETLGILVPEAQVRRYLELEALAKRRARRIRFDAVMDAALIVLSFVLGFSLATCIL